MAPPASRVSSSGSSGSRRRFASATRSTRARSASSATPATASRASSPRPSRSTQSATTRPSCTSSSRISGRTRAASRRRPNRRDAEELGAAASSRSCRATLDGALDRLRDGESEAALLRAAEDVAVLAQIAIRFLADKQLEQHPQRAHGRASTCASSWCAPSRCCCASRVRPGVPASAYVAGERRARRRRPTSSVRSMRSRRASRTRIDRTVMGAAERAFYRWLEDVCLDEENGAFEAEELALRGARRPRCSRRSPRPAIGPVAPRTRPHALPAPARATATARACSRGSSAGSCASTTSTTAAVMLHHAARLAARRRRAGSRALLALAAAPTSLALLFPALPFVAAAFFYREPWQPIFDVWIVALEVHARDRGRALALRLPLPLAPATSPSSTPRCRASRPASSSATCRCS